jgi:ribonuclease Z
VVVDALEDSAVIDVLLLGNGAMKPLPDRWLSSTLVRVGRDLLLLDCGEGTQIVYRRFGWGFKQLSTIILSHCHADHVAGLPGIIFSLAEAGRSEPVHIYGPQDTTRIVQGLAVIMPYLRFDLIVHELSDGDQFDLDNGLHVTVASGDHRNTPVLAWRFDLPRQGRFDAVRAAELGIPRDRWSLLQRGETIEVDGCTIEPAQVIGPPRTGLSFAFNTDTRPVPAHVEIARGVDLLINEATYLDAADQEKAADYDHMTLNEACAIAIEAGAKRLLLTHFSGAIANPLEYADAARALFPTAEIGYSGWTTTLAFSNE